ncbi:MAG: hypothetical protein FJ315_03990 [SAR202 cluster bacterium]|nr:hypothetical protein [SAR202 cluster bacterium]
MEAAIVAIVGGLIEVATHPQVRRCMESRGLDLRLFHQVQRVVPAMAHGHGEPTPEEEVQLAVTALMQLTEYPALRGEVEREFDEAYPEAARLAGELLGAAEASPVTDPKTFRELLRGMLSLADQHIKRRGGALPLSLYVPLPPICGMVELARPAKDVIRVTDTSVLTILQSDSRPQSTPPAVFLVWKEDNSTVQVRSLAHSSLMLQVKDSLRKQMEQPLEAFLKGLRVPFVAA